MVMEESEKYEILNDSKTIAHEHDKTYRKLLSNKKDVAHIINEALELKENQGKKKQKK